MAHLPNKVYRHLPDLYILGGVCVVLNIDHPIGVLGGLMLVAAGLIVFHLRLEYRSIREKHRQTRADNNKRAAP
ncbi:MAG: hypothetical protein A3B82_00700 [Methylophilales bacterium RIFCSPHIGHO2_02_FULL_57_10]|nr:MAG: hypothetical protein A3B82_00700 [Methylophilales bacterium RIFCSPHIGHO2_02_FULL_57_10]